MYLKKRLNAAQIIENSISSQNVSGRGQMVLETYHMGTGKCQRESGISQMVSRKFQMFRWMPPDGVKKVSNSLKYNHIYIWAFLITQIYQYSISSFVGN